MFFERFLNKKRQRDLPDETDQTVLTERARAHADPAVRREAARRLLVLAELRLIQRDDPDAGVREVAAARYRHLLCGAPSHEIAFAQRLAELAELQDQQTLDHIAIAGESPEIRHAAIQRLESQEQLARCAVQDPLALNRAAAIERVVEKAPLEQILRRIGKKDKNVYRQAREKLRLITEREERPARVRALGDELCQKAERLGRLEHWAQDRAILEHLDRQWAELREEANPDLRTRYESARAAFLQTYQAHNREVAAEAAAHQARAAIHAERLALLEQLAEAATRPTEAEIDALCEQIATAWHGLETLPAQEQQTLETRYRALLDAARTARQTLRERQKRKQRLAQASAKASLLIAEAKPLDLRAMSTFIEQTRALLTDLPEDEESSACAALIEQLQARAQTQRKHAERRLRQLPDKLAELEHHLADGELRKADPLYQSLRDSLDLISTSGLPKGSTDSIDARLHTLTPQLRELQQWRRWGTDQHREGLCEELETLVTADLALDVLSERLQRLRLDWRALDRSGPRASQALRDRFQQAGAAVHERCRPYLETRKAEHEANRSARTSVCEQIEDFLDKVDWERVDWKRVLRAERETRQAWASIGPVEPRHYRPLEARFRQALKQLDRRLDGERKRNQALKHTLIEQIQALADEPDLDLAIERVKALQRDWHTTVPARHKDENRLWQTFRAGCDAVFERRAALHQAYASELQEHLAMRAAICDEALALAERTADPATLAIALHALEQRWADALALPIPRHSGTQLSQRWQEARAAVLARQHREEERGRQAAVDLLERQAALCERLERALLEAPTAEQTRVTTATIEQDWARLPAQEDPETQAAMAARFARALAAARDPAALADLARLHADNAARLSQICLQLEILAGVETPPEHAQERLAFQVVRLTERMVDGEEDPLQGSARLLKEWYLCGPAPRGAALAARFARVREALSRAPKSP